MGTTFKSGDRVECILPHATLLPAGEYVIKKWNGEYVQVEGLGSLVWRPNRFKLLSPSAPEKPKVAIGQIWKDREGWTVHILPWDKQQNFSDDKTISCIPSCFSPDGVNIGDAVNDLVEFLGYAPGYAPSAAPEVIIPNVVKTDEVSNGMTKEETVIVNPTQDQLSTPSTA